MPGTAHYVSPPMSAKQETLIRRLWAERCTDNIVMPARNAMTVKRASSVIETLFAAPRKVQAESEKATPGYYSREEDGGEETDGEPIRVLYVVVANKAKTSTYAKRLVVSYQYTQDGDKRRRVAWEYAPGVGKTLASLEPLTVEQAAAFGHMHGHCAICCKPLTDPASVERGIGPVCIKRLGA